MDKRSQAKDAYTRCNERSKEMLADYLMACLDEVRPLNNMERERVEDNLWRVVETL